LHSFPIFIVDIRAIEKIVDSYSGKYDHFMLRGKNMDLHLKCDNMEDKTKWIEGIKYLKEYYKHDNSPLIIQKEMDDEMKLDILAENDLRFWIEIEGKVDYSRFIEDKSLDDIMDKASLESLKNRVLLSKVKKRTNTGGMRKESGGHQRESTISGVSHGSKA
jgi:hypothetical protein